MAARLTLLAHRPSLEVDGRAVELPAIGTRGSDLIIYLGAQRTIRLPEGESLPKRTRAPSAMALNHSTHRVAQDVCAARAGAADDVVAAQRRLASVKNRLPDSVRTMTRTGTMRVVNASGNHDVVRPCIGLHAVDVDLLDFHERVRVGDYDDALGLACTPERDALLPLAGARDAAPDWLVGLRDDYYEAVLACVEALVAEVVESERALSPTERSWRGIETAIRLNALRNALPDDFTHLMEPGQVAATDRELRELLRSAEPRLPRLRLGAVRPLSAQDWERVGVQRNVAAQAEGVDSVSVGHADWTLSFPPTVPRTRSENVDEAIDNALAGVGPALVVVRGTSGAGKTRLLFDRVRERFARHPVIAPLARSDIVNTLAYAEWRAARSAGTSRSLREAKPIIWIEDLELYAGDLDTGAGLERGLTPAHLVELERTQAAVIVATAGGKGQAQLPQPTRTHSLPPVSDPRSGLVVSGPGSPEQINSIFYQLLQAAAIVDLESKLDPDEYEAAKRQYGDDIAVRFRSEGLGAYFIAARALIDHYLDMRRRDPAAGAIVDSAIAWARLGMDRPLPEDLLCFIWERQLTAIRPSPEAFEQAIDDAAAPVAHIPTVRPVRWERDAITAHDYLARNAPASVVLTLDTTYELLPRLDGRQAFMVGQRVHFELLLSRQEESPMDEAAVRSACDLAVAAYRASDAKDFPAASTNLATLLWTEEHVRDLPAAVAACERGISFGFGVAAFNLGLMLSEESEVRDYAAAAEAYRRGAELGSEQSAERLGDLLLTVDELRDLDEAERAYRRSVELGNERVWVRIGLLLAEKEPEGDIAEPVAALRRAIAAGDEQGWFALGMLLEREGEERDLAGAVAAYRSAMAHREREAARRLGDLLRKEPEVRDVRAAVEAYRFAADQGDAEAAHTLGVLLRVDPSVRDLDGAIAAFARGAELGNPSSAFDLGKLLSLEAEPRDLPRAIEAYDQAIALGVGDAAANLGGLFFQEAEVRDIGRAIEVLERGVGLGSAACAYNLGVVFRDDEEVRDPLRSIEWFMTALDLGSAEAAAALGDHLRRQHPVDARRIIATFSRGAELGSAYCALQLGVELTTTRGLEDHDRAVEAFRRAIDLGSAEAADALGLLLSMKPTVKDVAGTVASLRVGSELGSGKAAWQLGKLLSREGELRDAREARKALERAIALGCLDAQADLGQLFAESREVRDLDAARRVYERGAERGDAGCANGLGVMLIEQPEVRDLRGAVAAFERAIELGSTHAANNLGVLLFEEESVRDVKRAIEILSWGLSQGSGHCAQALGDHLVRTLDPPDLTGAVAALQAGTDLGNAAAATNLGALLWTNDIVRDVPRAVHALRRGLELGAPEAGMNLAQILLEDEEHGDIAGAITAYEAALDLKYGDAAVGLAEVLEAEGDHRRAIVALQRGAELGSAASAGKLGMQLWRQPDARDVRAAIAAFRRFGELEPQNAVVPELIAKILVEEAEVRDLAAARAELEHAVGLGNGRAAAELGRLLSTEPETRNIPRAVAAFQKGLELGSANCALGLGLLFWQEAEVRDLYQALAVLRRGAEMGSADCMNNIGAMLADEPEVRCLPAAVKALSAAAKQGVAVAAFSLGRLYVVEPSLADSDAAVGAFDRALELGYGPAAGPLGALLSETDSEVRDLRRAVEVLERGAAMGDADAAFYLGRLLSTEDEVLDMFRALEAYELSVELGHHEAASEAKQLRREIPPDGGDGD